MSDPDLELCLAAVDSLSRIYDWTASDLWTYLCIGSYEQRRVAAGILGQEVPDSYKSTLVPALTNALSDQSSYRLRSLAARALGNFGSYARSSVPALQQALSDSHPEVREAAKKALRSIPTY